MGDCLKEALVKRFIRLRAVLKDYPDCDEFIIYQMRKEGFTEDDIRLVMERSAAKNNQEKLVRLEAGLMDAVEDKEITKTLLKDTKKFLQWRFKCKNASKEEIIKSWEEMKAKEEMFEKKLRQPLAKLGEHRKEWMELMIKLTGTHFQHQNVGRVEETRHDGRPGGYGSLPKPEECDNSGRRIIVLHSHGGWYRNGLMTRSQLDEQLPGLISLNGIVSNANEKRKKSAKVEIPPEKVELAFSEHHGIPIMQNIVIKGAYPDRMPLPPEDSPLMINVRALLEESKGKKNPASYIEEKCKKQYRNEEGKIPAGLQGHKVFRSQEHEALFKVCNRILNNTETRPGEYIDIIHGGSSEGEVMFPNMSMSHLGKQNENELRYMRAFQSDNYKVYTVQEDLISMEVAFGWDGTCNMKDALVEILSTTEIKDERPIRIVWACCRSEQFRKEFNDDIFHQWLKDAAEARRRAVRNWREKRKKDMEALKIEPKDDCLSKPQQSFAVQKCGEGMSTDRVKNAFSSIEEKPDKFDEEFLLGDFKDNFTGSSSAAIGYIDDLLRDDSISDNDKKKVLRMMPAYRHGKDEVTVYAAKKLAEFKS